MKTWKELLPVLREKGILQLRIRYCGSGDSGGIETVWALQKQAVVTAAMTGDLNNEQRHWDSPGEGYMPLDEIDMELTTVVTEVAESCEEVLQTGFDNDGSQGFIHLDVDKGEVHIHDEVNEMTYETHESAYRIDGDDNYEAGVPFNEELI